MRRRSTAAVVVALALALGACGGGDSGDDQQVNADEPSIGEQTGTTGAGGTSRPEGGPSEAVPELELDEGAEPVPKGSVPPDERTGRPSHYDRAKPLSKDQLKAIERPIYEQARYFCKRVGIEALKREYRVDSSDPEAVAREAARRTYQRTARDAVFSGCLAGLRSGS